MEDSSKRNMRPIRVCFYVFFAGGGIGRYTHTLLETMAGMPELDEKMVCPSDFKWIEGAEYECWPGLMSLSHTVHMVRRVRFLAAQVVNPRRVIRHARETDVDVIHFSNINHLSFPLWRDELAASGIRVAVTAHDVRRQKSIFYRSWEDRQLIAFYQFADAIFVHSVYQARELVDFAHISHEKIHIVPHGLYPHGPAEIDRKESLAKYGIPNDRQVALFFGQLRDEKNLAAFIRAMALCRQSPYLIVAGAETGRHQNVESYKNLAHEAGVSDDITFIPRFIPDEEVAELFTIADWIALPYSNEFTSQSGVLNVAAEYERPVLVSSSPVLSETVRNCDIGVACAGDTAAALAEGIDRLSTRISGGYDHAFEEYRRVFSWEENARNTLDVYRLLTENRWGRAF